MSTSPKKTKSNGSSLFYACYLLYSLAPTAKNVVYVGSTPNPQRRIRQHNGEIVGGAKKTVKKRPWEMVIVIYGFPSKFAALQFEWAWQNPHKSRHFKGSSAFNFSGKQKERYLPEKLRVLSIMLHLDHYCRWPLNLHFTSQEIYSKFLEYRKIPVHVRVTEGSLSVLPVIHELSLDQFSSDRFNDSCACSVCGEEIEIEATHDWLSCSSKTCPMISHIICLSRLFLESEGLPGNNLIPLHGDCPCCKTTLKWGKLINALKLRNKSPPETKQKILIESDESCHEMTSKKRTESNPISLSSSTESESDDELDRLITKPKETQILNKVTSSMESLIII